MPQNRKKSLLLLILLLVCTTSANMPLFWKVEGKTNTVYLLGTIHLGKDSFYPLPQSIEAAFEQSNHLILEANPKESDHTNLLPYMMFGPDSTIRDILSTDNISKLEPKLSENGLTLEGIQKFRPWAIMQMLTVLEAQKAGYDMEIGTEYYLLSKRPEITVHELESMEMQMELMLKIYTPEYLSYELDEITGPIEILHSMANAWQEGDSSSLHALSIDAIKSTLPEASKVLELLLYNRNKYMVQGIIPFLSYDEDVFIAVGTAHFLGELGIVDLLRKEGFEVKRVHK